MFPFSPILCIVWVNELQMETQESTSFLTLDWLLNLGDEPAAYKQNLYDLKATKTSLSCFPPHGKTHRTLQCTGRLKRKMVLLSPLFIHGWAVQCHSLCEDVLIPWKCWSIGNATHCHKGTATKARALQKDRNDWAKHHHDIYTKAALSSDFLYEVRNQEDRNITC